MTSIEDRFVAAVQDLAVPDVDLTAAVLQDVADSRPRSADTAGPRLRLAMAAVVALALAGGLMIAFGPTRRAVADWLGIGATAIEVDDNTESGHTTEVDQPPGDRSIDGEAIDGEVIDGRSGALPAGSLLGEPVELDAALTVAPIALLGPPDGIFDGDGRGRSFVWWPEPGWPALADGQVAVVLSVRRVAGAGLAIKSVAAQDDVEVVVVDREAGPVSGLWIDVDHELSVAGAARSVEARRVLLWEADGVEYRLETNGSLQATLGLAGSVADGTALLAAG